MKDDIFDIAMPCMSAAVFCLASRCNHNGRSGLQTVVLRQRPVAIWMSFSSNLRPIGDFRSAHSSCFICVQSNTYKLQFHWMSLKHRLTPKFLLSSKIWVRSYSMYIVQYCASCQKCNYGRLRELLTIGWDCHQLLGALKV